MTLNKIKDPELFDRYLNTLERQMNKVRISYVKLIMAIGKTLKFDILLTKISKILDPHK